MWLMTKKGYVSVIEWHDPKQGELAVRGRVKSHLEYARSLSPETADAEIHISPTKDYRYRFFASREAVAEIAANAVRDIDYGNFKDAVKKTDGKTPYEAALHSCWFALAKIQPGGAYGTGGGQPIPKGEPSRPKSQFSGNGWTGSLLCEGRTKKGRLCNNARRPGHLTCSTHADQESTVA